MIINKINQPIIVLLNGVEPLLIDRESIVLTTGR